MNTAVSASFRASQPLAVMLYGAPGSGKGTLGRMISQVTAWPHISTGELLRKHIAAGTPAGQASEGILAGSYAPDAVVNEIVADRMRSGECRNGVILDGYPRTLEQTKLFLPVLIRLGLEPVVLRLALDYNEIRLRLENRRLCPSCGAIYNLLRLPPRLSGVCDGCGQQLVGRPDDQAEWIGRRIDHYANLTGPVEQYLRQHAPRFWEFDGGKGPGDLLAELAVRLQETVSSKNTYSAAQ